MRRTKIIATLGPASEDAEVLATMMAEGVDVVRINLSHVTPEGLPGVFKTIRAAEKIADRSLGILLDTGGPEVRLGDESRDVEAGEEVRIVRANALAGELTVNWPGLFDHVTEGLWVVLDDGKLRARVKEASHEAVTLVMADKGRILPHKKLSCPEEPWPLDPLTPTDRESLCVGYRHGAHWAAISLIRSAKDLARVRDELAQDGIRLSLMAKIEEASAVDDLDGILRVADGVMVARGDLGVEMPLEDVPWLQKHMLYQARQEGIPSVTATEMLESMVASPRPTRAEVSDVANAVWDGTDAVMLSAETAAGKFPVEAVRAMAEALVSAEAHPEYRRGLTRHESSVDGLVSRGAVELAERVGARAILVATETGRTARLVAAERPMQPIIAYASDACVRGTLALVYAVIPHAMEQKANLEELSRAACDEARAMGVVYAPDRVVFVAGTPLGQSGGTNLIRLETVDAPLEARTDLGS